MPRAPVDRVEYERLAAEARTRSNPDAFAAAWAEGAAMTLNDALACALEEEERAAAEALTR
jgi:hypothetical protein